MAAPATSMFHNNFYRHNRCVARAFFISFVTSILLFAHYSLFFLVLF